MSKYTPVTNPQDGLVGVENVELQNLSPHLSTDQSFHPDGDCDESSDVSDNDNINFAVQNDEGASVDNKKKDNEQDEDGPCCRICGSDEDQELLIAPCDCTGFMSLVHNYCLQRWIESRPGSNTNITEHYFSQQYSRMALQQGNRSTARHNSHIISSLPLQRTVAAGIHGNLTNNNQFPNQNCRMTCEVCHADYRIQVCYRYRFNISRCCSAVSLGHCCELFILVVLLIVCVGFTPVLLQTSSEDPTFGSLDVVIIPTISSVMSLLTAVAIFKVFKRWLRQNSEFYILSRSSLLASSSSNFDVVDEAIDWTFETKSAPCSQSYHFTAHSPNPSLSIASGTQGSYLSDSSSSSSATTTIASSLLPSISEEYKQQTKPNIKKQKKKNSK